MSTFEQIANGETAANTDFDMEAVNDRIDAWFDNLDREPTMAEIFGIVTGAIYGVDFDELIAPASEKFKRGVLSRAIDYIRTEQAERDALERIGAIQKPRVLGLDEISDYMKGHVYVWVEDREDPECLYLFAAFYSGHTSNYIYVIRDDDCAVEGVYEKSNYGKTWRCWTGFPSDELMNENPMEAMNHNAQDMQ